MMKRNSPAASECLDVASRKQLFIDDVLLAESTGLSFTVNRPVKDEKPCVAADRPWESKTIGGFGSVIQEGDTYRMWYEALAADSPGAAAGKKIPAGAAGMGEYRNIMRLCYATSTDGVHWDKPDLGLVTFQGKSQNNIVFPVEPEEFEHGETNPVYLDTNPDCPPDERYKLLWLKAVPKTGDEIRVYTSPDGFRFKPLADNPSYGRSDTNNVLFWEERIGRYVAMVRKVAPGTERWREVGRCEFDDVRDWGEARTVLKADDDDPPNVDIYTQPTVRYEDVYVMFPSIYSHFLGSEYHNDGVVDIQFAASRDGIHWTRPDRKPFVPLSLDGQWDCRQLYMLSGLIKTDMEIWLYYAGAHYTHAEDDYLRTDGYAGGICRLRLRLDGFVSADAAYTGGELTTVSLVFEGNRLVLNVETGAGGSVQVEVLDDHGKPIPGFALKDGIPIEGNYIRKPVAWKNGSNLRSLVGKSVSLRFVMRDAKLYSFQFRP